MMKARKQSAVVPGVCMSGPGYFTRYCPGPSTRRFTHHKYRPPGNVSRGVVSVYRLTLHHYHQLQLSPAHAVGSVTLPLLQLLAFPD